MVHADQRSELDKLFDDEDKTDDTPDYNLNALFQEKVQVKQHPNLGALKGCQARFKKLTVWENLKKKCEKID